MNEFDWINFLTKKIKKGPGVLTGIGDDCAQVILGKERFLLKSDLFVEGVHFLPKQTRFKTIGQRAVARVLSDFAACGGWPKFIGISLGKPRQLRVRALTDILAGVNLLSRQFGFSLIGGDTCKSDKLFLDVWGVAQVKKATLRSGAKIGDYIFLTGPLGGRQFNQPFIPRLKEARYLIDNFKVNAMIDISDGFLLDLNRILEASHKGALLNQAMIPITNSLADLTRGEDYELIFTVDRAEPRIKLLQEKFSCVGQIQAQQFGCKIESAGKIKRVKPKGYQQF